jgi:hypothetical protein
MSVTIFEDKDCKGESRTVSGNIADLKGQRADKPSSARLSSADDEVLLFKNDDWHGGVLYLRGPKTVSDLGKKDEGGKSGFGNSIRSVRITPFQLDLNITVVKAANGKLPGDWASEAQARVAVEDVVKGANAFFAAQRALLTLETARTTFRTSDKQFTMNQNEGVPNDWTEKGEVDVIFVNRFSDDKGILGTGRFPCWGQTVVVAATKNSTKGADVVQSVSDMVYVLAHEIGHYLGLSHGSANNSKANIMYESAQATYKTQQLLPDQIEEMHEKLSRNISRRGDRN